MSKIIELEESLLFEDLRRKDKITIVGKQKGDTISIGVTRCGIGQKYDPKTGYNIASNRADIQPYTSIPVEQHASFNIVAQAICNHISNEVHPRIQNLRTTRVKKVKPQANVESDKSEE